MGFMNHFALESRAADVDNVIVSFYLQIEDCQEAMRWPGAIHPTNTETDRQSVF